MAIFKIIKEKQFGFIYLFAIIKIRIWDYRRCSGRNQLMQ
jgi:hypothetical protein